MARTGLRGRIATNTEPIRSSADGAHFCHASNAGVRLVSPQATSKDVTAGMGWILNVNEVAIPKFPPPPPRDAHRRSASSSAFARTSFAPRSPSGSTVWSSSRLSHVAPRLRDSTLMPPPNVTPAIPTVASSPHGTACPVEARALTSSPWVTPVPTTAVPAAASTFTCLNPLTSITTPPSSDDQPSSECRPLRTRKATSFSLHHLSALATSSEFWQKTTTSG